MMPKCLVNLKGKPLLQYQLDVFKQCGLTKITIVTGYRREALEKYGLVTYPNVAFAETNMVHSLMCAKQEFDDDVIVSYGDIIFEQRVLTSLIKETEDAAVVVDTGWQELWSLRMSDPLSDAESMVLDEEGYIRELGKKTDSLTNIQAQYLGLFKLSKNAIGKALSLYRSLDTEALYDGKNFQNMFMTSFLQTLIDHQVLKMKSVPVQHGWLEVDTTADLELYEELSDSSILFNFLDPAFMN